MTLVTTLSVSGDFAVMTTDTRKVNKTYYKDLKTGEYEAVEGSPLKVSQEKSYKVEFLSAFVMMGTGGTSELALYIKKKLRTRVNYTDDLKACGEKLKAVIDEIRLDEHAPVFCWFLDQTDGVYVLLNGFYEDGSNGLVVYGASPGAKVEEVPAPLSHSQWAMIPPVNMYTEVFKPKLQEGTLNEAVNLLLGFHGQIAYLQKVEVSSDCHYFIIKKGEGGVLTTHQGVFDTSIWHKEYDKNVSDVECGL
ncbi:hypothetical protein [Alkalihalobacterium alkalinitrilicum]|uniref:hypothetical protein n=1 Tax=Alkalihalobacterium alkalinitrilicum TaxID=427920 RepID=UPI000994C489|nr:hypothetical protein [Alkalihalobacterium alkalinitrilicum]